MEYIIDDKNNSESFYFNNNYDEESENIIKSYEENSFQKDNNINYKINFNKNKEKYKQYKKIQNQIFPIKIKSLQNRFEITTTKKNTFFNITKINNSTSIKDINEEKKILNQKRKEKKVNDKGHRKDTMTNRFKANFFIDMQEFISKIMANSEFCKIDKLRLFRIKNVIYNVSKASENLDLLKLKIKDVLSKFEKHNETIINLIINENVFPLYDIFNKNVKELMDIYCGKAISYESYYIDLIDRYNNFISRIENEKYPKYLEDFKFCVENFEKIFIDKNQHPRSKRKKPS